MGENYRNDLRAIVFRSLSLHQPDFFDFKSTDIALFGALFRIFTTKAGY